MTKVATSKDKVNESFPCILKENLNVQYGGREAQVNMEETDRERLPWVEAQRQLTLKKGVHGDQVWDLLWVQLAS